MYNFTSVLMIYKMQQALYNNLWEKFFKEKLNNNFWIYFTFVPFCSYYDRNRFFYATDFFKSTLLMFSWLKVRFLYYLNNWVYTTNHKRIAVNYFWFVILAGVFGMVLATVIRLELAYPGVGIFAGDSLQYLSLVTAHGVIMVFFMIIPLIAGAFANFLLPTQLGVHDVAFPRLNSAAFWFLPGGLMMLGQLICVDRRYQRMNAFNIREVQSILKRRFFVDLINTHDHHTMLGKTMIGLRFKTNDLNAIHPNTHLLYNYGIEVGPKFRSASYLFSTNSGLNIPELGFSFDSLVKVFLNSTVLNYLNTLLLSIFNNFNYQASFFFYFKSLYFSIMSFFVSLTFGGCSELTKSFNIFLDSLFSFFKNVYTFDVINFIRVKVSLLSLSLTEALLTLVENNLNVFLLWLKFKHWVFTFGMSTTGVTSFLKRYTQSNLFTSFSYANYLSSITTTVYEFFFILPLVEQLSKANKSFISLNFIFYTTYGYIFSHISTIYLSVLDFFKTPHISSDVSFRNSLFRSSTDVYFIYDKNAVMRAYWSNLTLYRHSLGEPTIKKVDLPHNINYNSYMVYFHILMNVWYNIPYFTSQFFMSIFNPRQFIIVGNDFYNFMVDWYIPLLLNDNILTFYLYFGKNETLRFFSISVNNAILSSWEYLVYFLGFFFSTLHNLLQFSFNVSLFLWYLNSLVTQLALIIYEHLVLLMVVLSSLVFNVKPFLFFEAIYNTAGLYLPTKGLQNTYNMFDKRYVSNYFNTTDSIFQTKYAGEELSLNARYQRFSNPVFKYDFKSGDYFPKLYKELYTYLFSTILDTTSALRTSPWFISSNFADVFNGNFNNFFENISKTNAVSLYSIHSWDSSRIKNTDAFYNFFYTLNTENIFTSKRWVSMDTLNQKFHRMFFGSSLQQRVYSNWRQLKFTREAWRCKLLSARHQKTLFRRYVHEDGIFWSIERNARDLLPGWAMITPFSSRVRYTAIGKTDIGLLAVFLVLNSSIISAANFLVTYRYLSTLNNRKMRDSRSFFTEGIMCTSWMMLAANPMLAIGILMLLSDRHWQTSFFDYSGGGDTVLFQHMFWFFGHPEVYIVVIPCFGFTNTIISYFLKKRVSARASLLYSMYTIAFLGFFVWGHHMYMVGLAHTTRMLFSTLTVMISVPAATKIMHWCVTLANSAFTLELPLLCILTFVFLFVSGGISGMCVAHTGMDVLFHDTFYVIGHFHIMFAGAAMFACFGAFYFYFPAIFGVKYSRIFAYIHYTYYLIGHLMTFIPMFWLGYAGMPRRILDYPSAFGGWHSVISAGHMLAVAGMMAFFIMIFDSLRQARAATRNTFGISRYNTRLSFYLYENARLVHVQRKSWYLYRFLRPSAIKLNGNNYTNLEYLETTLFSYTFTKK